MGDLKSLQDTINNNLNQSNFKSKNSQKTFSKDLDAVIKQVNAGSYATAIDKLQSGTLPKVDGCTNTGTPDKNDLIVDCTFQKAVYVEVSYIIQELQVLQGS